MMDTVLLEISRGQQLMTWALVWIAFLTFLALVWSAYVAFLVRREGHETREVLKEIREDSKRMQFYMFSKFGPADLK